MYLETDSDFEKEEYTPNNDIDLSYDSSCESSGELSCESSCESSGELSCDSTNCNIIDYYETPYFSEITKNYLLGFLYTLLIIYTDIQLYFKNLFYPDKPKVLIDDIKLSKSKSEYNYYKNNKIIATSNTLTNRKNYDFALCTHDTNINKKYTEIILCYNKIKKRNISICEKYFISVYFIINQNDYEIKFYDDNFNIYLTCNIIDYNIISYIMSHKFNVNISNVPYNLILIDNDSNVIELKETECIRFYKNRYVIGKYD